MLMNRLLPAFKNCSVSEITHKDIETFKRTLKVSKQTRKNILSLLKTILAEAKMDGIIKDNPFDLVKPIRIDDKRKFNPFSLAEIKSILDNTDAH